jgi:hypothetical protein
MPTHYIKEKTFVKEFVSWLRKRRPQVTKGISSKRDPLALYFSKTLGVFVSSRMVRHWSEEAEPALRKFSNAGSNILSSLNGCGIKVIQVYPLEMFL